MMMKLIFERPENDLVNLSRYSLKPCSSEQHRDLSVQKGKSRILLVVH